ncbi:MAG: c-type cytochrome, partial [Sedimenticolaceae bacterium]|nr:c-type cytochrome [Sedimenticolaceae bacterium]
MKPILLLPALLLISINLSASESEIEKALSLKPDIENGREAYELCATCHLENGWGKPDGSFPVIAGQHRKVLIKQLADIRARNRENPTMYPFTDPETIGGVQAIADVTEYISTLPANPAPGTGEGDNLELAEGLYKDNCLMCHGKDGMGNGDAFFPRLQGQHHAYLVRQMLWIRDGFRKNGNALMVEKLKPMTDEQISKLADYISRMPAP